MDKYAKKNISAKQPPEGEEARISRQNENRRRTQRNQEATRARPQEAVTVSLLGFRLPKENRLRKRRDFQKVYSEGKRIKGRFMTAFIMASETSFQRIGITASKKAIGNAVKRNRAKRLLREAFRLSGNELGELKIEYDWVVNAHRSLLEVKLDKPLKEFKQIVEKVKRKESELNKGDVGIVEQ